MLELEEAVARILRSVPTASPETLAVSEAHNRFLAEPVVSPVDLPLFDNSAMDGYAVRAADVASVKAELPAKLKLIGKVAAGESFNGKLEPGQCIRIFTGSALPEGADAVVMQEDTRMEPSDPSTILMCDAAKPWENVRLRGQDSHAGTTLVESGEKITAARVALLAATGIARVKVGQRPRVALLATGSELCEPSEQIKPGQIYESNRLALAALISASGGIPRIFPLVRDDLGSTATALENAFGKCDIVVTSGGVSVGEMDFVKQAFEETGGKLEFWKVAIKPGRPFVYGQRKEKLLFGLPGNPVSAFVTFLLLVRPALLRWQGASEVNLPVSRGEIAEPISNQGRRHFARVRVTADGKVYSTGVQASHMLGSLAMATGLLDVQADTTLAAGTAVNVLRWE